MKIFIIKFRKFLSNILFVFSFVLGLGLASVALAFSLPPDSHIYQYEQLEGGKGYKLEYYTEFDVASPTGCPANQCYFDGKCFLPGACLYQFYSSERNKYCLLASWRNSCGNGIVQGGCGEECEFTGGADYCDQNFGKRNWYKEKEITIKCTANCTWEKARKDCGEGIFLPYCKDDCGGFCGDGQTQSQFKEQCDTGQGEADYAGGKLTRIDKGGLGGLNVNSQYECSSQCRAAAGFCGDGVLQNGKQEGRRDASSSIIYNAAIDYGEKCDPFYYNNNPPKPESSAPENQYQCQPAYSKKDSNGLCSGDRTIACSSSELCPTGKGPCDTVAPCWPTAGWCGDNLIQNNFGEDCDDGKNQNPADLCTDACQKTYCGDGYAQKPNGQGKLGRLAATGWRIYATETTPGTGYEWCDEGQENGRKGHCAADCSGMSIGGQCGSDNDCAQDLICDSGVCKGALGSAGCQSDSDCIGGYYCDLGDTQCKLYTAVFLGLHPLKSETGTCNNDADCSAGKICFENKCAFPELPYNCPHLVGTYGGDLLDQCTGLIWQKVDAGDPGQDNSLRDFDDVKCSGIWDQPTVRQLWSLVGHHKTSPPFTDILNLKLGNEVSPNNCPRYCHSDDNVNCKSGVSHTATELNCSQSPGPVLTDLFVYWTRDTYGTFQGQESDYAVNFGSGAVEIYPKSYLLRTRCVRKPAYCGDQAVNGNEECDNSVIVEDENGVRLHLNGQTCDKLGFAGGTLACTSNCKFNRTNCVNIESQLGKTCQQVCSPKGLTCKGIGTNVTASDSTYWTYRFEAGSSAPTCYTVSPPDPCNTVMVGGGTQKYYCQDKEANWTYCNCGGWPLQ